MALNSNFFEEHLLHLDKYLCVIKDSGLTFGLPKIRLAKGEISFLGQIVGLGKKRADPEKVSSAKALQEP